MLAFSFFYRQLLRNSSNYFNCVDWWFVSLFSSFQVWSFVCVCVAVVVFLSHAPLSLIQPSLWNCQSATPHNAVQSRFEKDPLMSLPDFLLYLLLIIIQTMFGENVVTVPNDKIPQESWTTHCDYLVNELTRMDLWFSSVLCVCVSFLKDLSFKQFLI